MEAALADWNGVAPFRQVLSGEGCSGFARRPLDEYEEVVELIDVHVTTLDDLLPPELPIRFLKEASPSLTCTAIQRGGR